MRENTTHYTIEYTCKRVLVDALGCERTIYLKGICKTQYLYVKDCLSLYVHKCYKEHKVSQKNIRVSH